MREMLSPKTTHTLLVPYVGVYKDQGTYTKELLKPGSCGSNVIGKTWITMNRILVGSH